MSDNTSIYKNLAKGDTKRDKLDIIGRNAFDIDTLCDLMGGFDTSVTDEPIVHANNLVHRLSREIFINYAGLSDDLREDGNHD